MNVISEELINRNVELFFILTRVDYKYNLSFIHVLYLLHKKEIDQD